MDLRISNILEYATILMVFIIVLCLPSSDGQEVRSSFSSPFLVIALSSVHAASSDIVSSDLCLAYGQQGSYQYDTCAEAIQSGCIGSGCLPDGTCGVPPHAVRFPHDSVSGDPNFPSTGPHSDDCKFGNMNRNSNKPGANRQCDPDKQSCPTVPINKRLIHESLKRIGIDENTDLSKLTNKEWKDINLKINAEYAKFWFATEIPWLAMASTASNLVGWGEEIADFPPRNQAVFDGLRTGNLAIYEDLAWQFEAYKQGGFEAIQEFYRDGLLDDNMFNAWSLISKGDGDLKSPWLWEGTMKIADHEQNTILQNQMYNKQRDVWQDFTNKWYDLSSFIPLAHDFEEFVKNHGLGIPDIGNQQQRWKWISEDQIPAFKDFLVNYPSEVAKLQHRLSEKGFMLPIDINSLFGPGT
jgi:hypothetical protein